MFIEPIIQKYIIGHVLPKHPLFKELPKVDYNVSWLIVTEFLGEILKTKEELIIEQYCLYIWGRNSDISLENDPTLFALSRDIEQQISELLSPPFLLRSSFTENLN